MSGMVPPDLSPSKIASAIEENAIEGVKARGTLSSHATAREARVILQVTLAIDEAARTGRPVTLSARRGATYETASLRWK